MAFKLPDWPTAKKILIKNFLPLGFLIIVIFSLGCPEPGNHAAHIKSNGWKVIQTINMCIIFFIFGITLETTELIQALKAWKALIAGLVSILILTALSGFITMRLPFQPHEFSIGLAIMACVPTSLSSGVTLVIQGYGNGALALLYTVSSNALGIITAPLTVKMVLQGTNAKVDSTALLLKLSVSILMPLFVGKALRELYKPTIKFAKQYKVPLYMFNNLQIICIVWQVLSTAQEVLMEQHPGDVIMAIVAAIVLHIIFLLLHIIAVWLLRVPEKERKAIIIMCSQKNLPVAAVIIGYFDSSVGNAGLISIPCIVFYVMQLFIDAYLANSWASKYERLGALEEQFSSELKTADAEHASYEKLQQQEQEEADDKQRRTTDGGFGTGIKAIAALGGAAESYAQQNISAPDHARSRTADNQNFEEVGLLSPIELSDAGATTRY